MKKLLAASFLLLFSSSPALAQALSPVQQFLYNESGYTPPAATAPTAPAPQETATTAPTPEAPGLTPVQQYMYSEAGYAPPAAAQPAPAADAYVTANVAPDAYVTEETDVAYESGDASLQGMNF